MGEVINFNKAKKKLDKELKLILKGFSDEEQIMSDDKLLYTEYQVDEHTTIKKSPYGYQKISVYPEGRPC